MEKEADSLVDLGAEAQQIKGGGRGALAGGRCSSQAGMSTAHGGCWGMVASEPRFGSFRLSILSTEVLGSGPLILLSLQF